MSLTHNTTTSNVIELVEVQYVIVLCVSDTSQLLNFIELVTFDVIVLCVSNTSQLLNFIELVTSMTSLTCVTNTQYN